MAVSSPRPTSTRTPASNATHPERDTLGPPGTAGRSIRVWLVVDVPCGSSETDHPGVEAVDASSALISNGAAPG